MLDSVAERTVSTLLRATEPRTSAEIARTIGMSESSVRHKMPAARAFIEGHGLALSSARGKGYWIEGDAALRGDLAAALDAERDPSVSYAYRRDCILTMLLASSSPCTLQALAEDAGVGRGTIASDLSAVERWLIPFGVELVRTRNAGVSLRGEEPAFREALIESRHQLALEGVAHHARPDDLDYRVSGTFYDYFRAFYGDDGKLRRLLGTVLAAERSLGYRFEDAPFLRIFEHVALMCDRERSHGAGKRVTPPPRSKAGLCAGACFRTRARSGGGDRAGARARRGVDRARSQAPRRAARAVRCA